MSTFMGGQRPVGSEVAIEINGVVRKGFTGFCRSLTCQASVVFVPMNGKTPPYNADGISHFVTCPDAAKWKNRSKKEPARAALQGAWPAEEQEQPRRQPPGDQLAIQTEDL